MAKELAPQGLGKGKLAKAFQNRPIENDLGSGITAGGFAVVGYRGKTWSYRYQGNEHKLMRPDGDGPRSFIDVVVLASSKFKSKVWYEKGYQEGVNAPPDCWSGNGIHPNPNSPKLQNPTCADCPRNVWGGRITENNKRAKECSDSKRLAVVPLDDITNEKLGGPMLLRVPAKSLLDLSAYGAELQKLGYHSYAVATRVAFDPEEAYPKFKFAGTRELDDKEATQVVELLENPLIERILDESGDTVLENVAAPVTATPQKFAPAPVAKVINSTAFTPEGNMKATVKPRVAKPVEVEDAEVVEEAAAPVEGVAAEEGTEGGEGEDEEAFDKALDAKLSAFLGGKKT